MHLTLGAGPLQDEDGDNHLGGRVARKNQVWKKENLKAKARTQKLVFDKNRSLFVKLHHRINHTDEKYFSSCCFEAS